MIYLRVMLYLQPNESKFLIMHPFPLYELLSIAYEEARWNFTVHTQITHIVLFRGKDNKK